MIGAGTFVVTGAGAVVAYEACVAGCSSVNYSGLYYTGPYTNPGYNGRGRL